MTSVNQPYQGTTISSGSNVNPAFNRCGMPQPFDNNFRGTVNTQINPSLISNNNTNPQAYVSSGSQVNTRNFNGVPVGSQQVIENNPANMGTVTSIIRPQSLAPTNISSLGYHPTQTLTGINRFTGTNQLLGTGPITSPAPITASRVRQTIRNNHIEVHTAAGPPLPPLRASTYNASESIVRPVGGSLLPVNQSGQYVEKRYTVVDEFIPNPVANQQPIQGPVVYQKIVRQAGDPQRQKKLKLYQGTGYKQSKRSTPCCCALLGLLALAGLLTGLFFLIKAINAGAGSTTVNRTDVNYKQNSTTTNSTSNNTGVIIIPPGNSSVNTNTSPIVIDVNTNPTVVQNTTSNSSTSTSTNTVVIPSTTTTTTTTTTSTTTNGTGTTISNTSSTNGSSINTNTNTSTSTNTSTTTNTSKNNASTSGTSTSTSTASGIPANAVTLTQQQISNDPNVKTIDSYLRQQDASRLGTNPTLSTVATTTDASGSKTYYYDYSTSSGKHYIYGVIMGATQPIVKTVSITQSTTVTAHHRHRLQVSQANRHQLRAV